MGHNLLVPRSGRRGGRSRCYRLGAVERIEGSLGVTYAIYYAVGIILRVGRRRRVRGRGGVHSGRHGVVQFGITADKGGGGCTRVALFLRHISLVPYPHIGIFREAHEEETYY